MMYHQGSFTIFGGNHIESLLEEQRRRVQAQIESESDDYVMNVNETEYISFLFAQFAVKNVDLKFNEISVSSEEKLIPAEAHPFKYDVRRGSAYKRVVIVYHVPIEGNHDLLRYKPSILMHPTPKVRLEDNCICFEIINFDLTPEEIKQEVNKVQNRIVSDLGNLKKQVDSYNDSLENHIKQVFHSRKQYLLKKNELVASLGVPLKRKTNLPETFAIPTSQSIKKFKVKKPSVTERGFKPEPTLDDSIYKAILQVIFDVGKQFERLPSTYSDKNEEALRDHFLLYLEPRFEGSATGETFNKSGKTDILIRYEGSNVFIAECKFWRGEKSFLEALTQLLSYLTWRDSKAAIIFFVRNQEFTSIIDVVKNAIGKHQNYLGFVDTVEETWLNYRFHIEGDRNREVKLGVLLFHIPKAKRVGKEES